MIRGVVRLACLLLVLAGGTVPVLSLAQLSGQLGGQPPAQRPFSQLIDTWTRQLDRITARVSQPTLLPAEIDALRDEATDLRTAAGAQAALARNDLADTKRLLAPLEPKTVADKTDQPPETDTVKAERARLNDQAAISESRVKQCEVIIVRADQLLERMTKLRSEVVIQTLLHRDASPLSPDVWTKLRPQFTAAMHGLVAGFDTWGRDGLPALRSGERDLTPLAIWAVVTIALWWAARALRQRFGRGELSEPGQRDRTIAAAIDGLGVVLVPILAVWLVGRLLAASQPPAPIDTLLPELIARFITFLLVVGLTAFLCEIGVTPVLCATGARGKHLDAAIHAATPYVPSETLIKEGLDFAETAEVAPDLKPDFLIGSSKGYKISRSLNVPLIRVGFPIHDRIGGQRVLHLGYRGAQELYDRIVNALLEAKQDHSTIAYSYL